MHIFVRYAAITGNLPNHFPTVGYDARFLFIISGKGEMRFSDKEFPIYENTLCYYPAGTQYYPVSSKEEPLRFVTVNFDFSHTHKAKTSTLAPVAAQKYNPALALMTHTECEYNLFGKYFVIYDTYSLREDFIEAAAAFNSEKKYSSEIAASIIQLICFKILENNRNEKNKLYRQITEYINVNYPKIQGNSDIAKALNYHPYYLNQLFKKETGMTLHKYVMDIKLKKGAELLLKTTDSISKKA